MATVNMDRLLQACVTQGASDIHLVTDRSPVFRIHGQLKSLETKVLGPDDTVALMKSITPERNQQEIAEQGGTDDAVPGLGHRVPQQKTLPFERDVAEAFVGKSAFIGRFGGAGKPSLVDAAALGSIGVPVAGIQFEPSSRMEKAARNPVGDQPQNPLSAGHRAVQMFLYFALGNTLG